MTINLSGPGSLSGAGAIDANDDYILTGTAAQITQALQSVSFTPVDGVAATSVMTSFTLTDASGAGTMSPPDATTTVTDTDPSVAPTISGTIGGQTTTGKTTILPFASVQMTDPNQNGSLARCQEVEA